MRKLSILFEEVINEYSLDDGDVDYDLYERFDGFKRRVLELFLYKNNEDYTARMGWRLIPYPRLKRIWEEYARLGFVRDKKGLEMIEEVMISNTIKIHVLTILSGHSPQDPDDDFEDAWGEYIDTYLRQYLKRGEEPDINNPNQLEFDWNSNDGIKKKVKATTEEIINDPYLDEVMEGLDLSIINVDGARKKLFDKLQGQFFWYYIEDPAIGQMRISDYGLEPLIKYMSQLRNTYDHDSKVIIIDKMLNVVHQRSDMASWFVKGGSDALSDLASSPSEKEEQL